MERSGRVKLREERPSHGDRPMGSLLGLVARIRRSNSLLENELCRANLYPTK